MNVGQIDEPMNTENLKQLTEIELLELLGQELVKNDAAAFPFRPEQFRLLAEKWLTQNSELLREMICPNSGVRKLCQSGSQVEDGILVAHVSALLLHRFDVDVTLVAILLVRRGVHGLCKSTWAT
jgi:hypothetical protein